MEKTTNKDSCFIGQGRSLQSYIDQENAEKTMPMNNKGLIKRTLLNSRAFKNNMLEPIDIYEDRVSYVYSNYV